MSGTGTLCAFTKEDVFHILRNSGIPWNSRNERDYVRAKRIISKDDWIPEYDSVVNWIAEYVGV